MTTPTLEQRISFWKCAYARASFVDTQIFLEQLLSCKLTLTHPLRKATSIAVLTTYCRPFKQRAAVRLNEDVVPAQYRDLHNSLLEMRDKVVAHRDLDGPNAEWGFVSQLEITVSDSEIVIDTNSPVLPDLKAKEILPLCSHLIESMDNSVNKFVAMFRVQFSTEEGVYVLRLDDEGPEWTKKVK